MGQEKYKYEIGGKIYTQSPMKFIQIQQLIGLIDKVLIAGNFSPQALTLHLLRQGLVPRFLSIILIAEGTILKDKDIEKMAEGFEYEMGVEDMEEGLRAVEDFFDCNLEPSRSGRVKEAISRLGARIQEMMPLKRPSVSSQEETSQKESTSSTTADQEKPGPILNSETGNTSSESTSSPSQKAGE